MTVVDKQNNQLSDILWFKNNILDCWYDSIPALVRLGTNHEILSSKVIT